MVEGGDEIFPDEVVGDQTDWGGDGKDVSGESGECEVEKRGHQNAERGEDEGEERAVDADGEMRALMGRDEENIPEAPEIGNNGHREYDDALDRKGKVEDVSFDGETGGDEKQSDGRNDDAGHVCA